MATLTDRLDYVIGARSAGPLEEHFGIRTVNDLLRHFPRKYSEGMTVLGEDGEPPEEGEHITFVDTITKAEVRWTNRTPKREYLVVTLGNRRPKVTATFFNAKFLKKTLVVGTRLMLSGEVGYFKGTMQLTHPAFLILDGARQGRGTKSMAKIAEGSNSEEDMLAAFERDYFPIYPASAKVQSWDIFACVRQVLDMLDPISRSAAEIHCAAAQSDIRGRGPEGDSSGRDGGGPRTRPRAPDFRRSSGAGMGACRAAVRRAVANPARRHREGPMGLLAALLGRLPFELTSGQREVLDTSLDRTRRDPSDEPDAAG